jgi:CheY-like chemotaxis protein
MSTSQASWNRLPKSLNVLLVEDQAILALHTQYLLEQLGCRIVGCAATAMDAEGLATKHTPDLIVMDIKLKGRMDGVEAATRLRAWYRGPIIFASGMLDDAMCERLKGLPSVGVLRKPFSIEELRDALMSVPGVSGRLRHV